ncbi:MAG: phosphatase PAP2 family protein [Actinomycetota bacterium]|nr:phosphatase PAP2 family protein [Actinomycetota bacterium]
MSTTSEAPTFVPVAPKWSLRSVVPADVLRPARFTLMGMYLAAYLYWLRFKGLPIDRISVAISVGLFLVCAFVGRSWRTWGVLLLDCLAYCAMWYSYEATRGAADRGVLGLDPFPLQVESVRNIDRVLFLGHDPNVVLQNHFYQPGVVRWYDVVLSTTYMTHFVLPMVIMAVLWVTSHRQWARFMKRFATLLGIACVMFVVMPTAPPWMAAKNYHLIDPIARPINWRGFYHLGFHGFTNDYKVQLSDGNPVAAMPSLHASFALIVPAFFLPWVRQRWLKATMLTFPVVMLVALVYFGEHWVIDGLAGWVITGGTFWYWNRREQLTRRLRAGRARAALGAPAPAAATADDRAIT